MHRASPCLSCPVFSRLATFQGILRDSKRCCTQKLLHWQTVLGVWSAVLPHL